MLSHSQVWATHSYHFEISNSNNFIRFLFHNYIYFSVEFCGSACVSVSSWNGIAYKNAYKMYALNPSNTTWFMRYCACFNLIFLLILWSIKIYDSFTYLHLHFYLWDCFLSILWARSKELWRMEKGKLQQDVRSLIYISIHLELKTIVLNIWCTTLLIERVLWSDSNDQTRALTYSNKNIK